MVVERSRIVILDEATSSVDVATDAMMIRAVREAFSDATVLAIAHRLNAILDYDRMLVLDERLASDTPQALGEQRADAFFSLANEWIGKDSDESEPGLLPAQTASVSRRAPPAGR